MALDPRLADNGLVAAQDIEIHRLAALLHERPHKGPREDRDTAGAGESVEGLDADLPAHRRLLEADEALPLHGGEQAMGARPGEGDLTGEDGQGQPIVARC